MRRLGWTLFLVGLATACGTTTGAAPTVAISTTIVTGTAVPPPATTAVLTTTSPTTTLLVPSTTAPAKGALGASHRFGDATAQVVVGTCDGTTSGTGFAVDDRHMVTNQHVVGDAQKVALHRRDGSVVLGEVIGGNRLVDVAVIEVPAGTFTVVTKWGDSSKVLEGQPLTIIGYPGKGDYDVVEVSVRSIAKDATELRVTSGIDHGNSGSPAISEDGEVMGIARAAGVVVSIENYGSLIPSSLAQAIVNGMIARPDHTPRPVSCETKVSAATSAPPTSSAAAKPGSESLGLWIAQLGSSNLLGNADAVAADLRKLQEVDSSTRYLFSQDWPATFDASDRVIFYLGGYPSKQRALDQCTRLNLAVPSKCLVRQLVG